MKESMWGYLIIAFGVVIIVFMILVQDLTSTSEEDFYLTREVLEASMYDAIDYGTYAKSGKLVMSESKFVEVFLRRFAENVTNNKDYTINFYDIHEYPPKATVVITTQTGTEEVASDSVNINIVTYLNAILETTYTYIDNRKISNPKGSDLFELVDGTSFKIELNKVKHVENESPIKLSYKFYEMNDACGYYIAKKDGNFYMSKDEDAEYYNKINEYCYGEYADHHYFVKKEDLVKEPIPVVIED